MNFQDELTKRTDEIEKGIREFLPKEEGFQKKVIEAMNPTAAAKAVKNSVEQENMRRVHVQDGLVLTRFLRWVKEK